MSDKSAGMSGPGVILRAAGQAHSGIHSHILDQEQAQPEEATSPCVEIGDAPAQRTVKRPGHHPQPVMHDETSRIELAPGQSKSAWSAVSAARTWAGSIPPGRASRVC
jgi:hypothetical protein